MENLLADVKKLNNCEGDFPNKLQDYQLTVGDDVRKVYATGKINFTQPFDAGTWYRTTSSLCIENYDIKSCSRYYAWNSSLCDQLQGAPDLWQQLMKGTPDMPKACPIPAKFRLFGDLDCPDWILAEINSMARMTSIKVKMLSQNIAQSIITGDLEFEKVKRLTTGAKFDDGDSKACVAALSLLLRSAARFSVDAGTLGNELQQLGLPREHAAALCKVHLELAPAIVAVLERGTLRVSRLEDVNWRLDMLVDSSRSAAGVENGADEGVRPGVQLALKVTEPASGRRTAHTVQMTPLQLAALVAELKKATSIVESCE